MVRGQQGGAGRQALLGCLAAAQPALGSAEPLPACSAHIDSHSPSPPCPVPTRSFKDCMPTAGDANFVKPAILLPVRAAGTRLLQRCWCTDCCPGSRRGCAASASFVSSNLSSEAARVPACTGRL